MHYFSCKCRVMIDFCRLFSDTNDRFRLIYINNNLDLIALLFFFGDCRLWRIFAVTIAHVFRLDYVVLNLQVPLNTSLWVGGIIDKPEA